MKRLALLALAVLGLCLFASPATAQVQAFRVWPDASDFRGVPPMYQPTGPLIPSRITPLRPPGRASPGAAPARHYDSEHRDREGKKFYDSAAWRKLRRLK